MTRAPDRSVLNRDQRRAALAAATTGPHDVVVVGAGATGAGAALDAVGRGLSTVLVEAGDFAAGTSSRSGKTFHGGLRYLEQFNVTLVRAALHERNLMVSTLCPYLATPEPFLYPLTRRHERPYVGAGIALYDAMTMGSAIVPHHRHFGRQSVMVEAPGLDAAVVRGGIRYYDVRIDDARHVVTLVRTAAATGAHVLSRTRVVGFLDDRDRVAGVVVRDELTGDRHEIRARVVINATGIWASRLQKLAGAETFRVTAAKGVHLVFAAEALDSRTGIFARAEDSVIIIRRWWDFWLLGTTDTPFAGDYHQPRTEPAEVDYLLRNINRYLVRKLTRADIIGTYAGLRPLLTPRGGDPATTSALSRDHTVIGGPNGLVTVVGGKYTTYRRMAEDAVDAACRQLDRVAPSNSERQPVVGTHGWEAMRNRAGTVGRRFGLPTAEVLRLVGRYGALTEEVLAPALDDPALARPLPGSAYLGAEFRYAVSHEGALTLEDILWHRTHVSFETRDGGAEVASHVAMLVAPVLGWDDAERDAQIKTYLEWIDTERAAI